MLEEAWLDDLLIHDADAPNAVYALRSASRQLDVRVERSDRPSRHGAIDRSEFYGGQTFNLAGYVRGATDDATHDAYDELLARLVLPDEHVFRFRRKGRTFDERVVFKQAAGFEAPAEGFAKTVRYAGSLFAADPRVYADALKTSTYDPTLAGAGGMAIPIVFPIVFTATTATLLEAFNAGTFKTPPIFTIRGPIANPVVRNETTGEEIRIDYVLGSNDEIVIDVAARTVKLNGASRRDLFLAAVSTWWSLAKGTNGIRLSGSGMSTGSTELVVSFRDARI